MQSVRPSRSRPTETASHVTCVLPSHWQRPHLPPPFVAVLFERHKNDAPACRRRRRSTKIRRLPRALHSASLRASELGIRQGSRFRPARSPRREALERALNWRSSGRQRFAFAGSAPCGTAPDRGAARRVVAPRPGLPTPPGASDGAHRGRRAQRSIPWPFLLSLHSLTETQDLKGFRGHLLSNWNFPFAVCSSFACVQIQAENICSLPPRIRRRS